MKEIISANEKIDDSTIIYVTKENGTVFYEKTFVWVQKGDTLNSQKGFLLVDPIENKPQVVKKLKVLGKGYFEKG